MVYTPWHLRVIFPLSIVSVGLIQDVVHVVVDCRCPPLDSILLYEYTVVYLYPFYICWEFG